jgi:hypothetical protein
LKIRSRYSGVIAVPQITNQVALPLVLVLGAFLVSWYLVGNELMRRRGRALALWCKRSLDPLGGKQAVQWITLSTFRLDAEGLREPFQQASLTGLTEAWDVPMIWLANRMRGRRDMVLLRARLRRQPIWGLELYRPGSLLAADARHLAREERWSEEAVDELRLASAGGSQPRQLAESLLADLGPQRARLVRLAVRRRDTHLTLALNVPRLAELPPAEFQRLCERLARSVLRFATPAE